MTTTLFILAALVLYAFAQNIGDDCMSAADCNDGCCMMMMDMKMKCHMKAMMGEKCDFMGDAKDACMCQDDMMCMNHNSMDMEHGICMKMMNV